MAKVKGQWRWNEVLNAPSAVINEYVDFTTNNYFVENFYTDGEGTFYCEQNGDGVFDGGYGGVYDFDTQKWTRGEVYRLIDFGTTEQEVSDEFYTYLTENAVAITWFETSKIGTTTLATAGKYCDRNIAVNVAIPVYDGKILLGTFTISSSGTTGGSIPQGWVTTQVYIQDDASNAGENYKTSDVFLAYGYAANNEGEIVPVLYKTDIESFPDEVDYYDIFFYEGTYEHDGVLYDKWRKIEPNTDNDWDGDVKRWYLTNRVVDVVARIEV